MARGDNNQHGSAGRGSSNQSNQAFITTEGKRSKSNHGRKPGGGQPSAPSPKTADPDAERNRSLQTGKQHKNK